MKIFEKFFKCFKFSEKKTFFRKKKFSLPRFLLLCCAVFLFMHSCTYVLLGQSLSLTPFACAVPGLCPPRSGAVKKQKKALPQAVQRVGVSGCAQA
jgi:hypothetical protein